MSHRQYMLHAEPAPNSMLLNRCCGRAGSIQTRYSLAGEVPLSGGDVPLIRSELLSKDKHHTILTSNVVTFGQLPRSWLLSHDHQLRVFRSAPGREHLFQIRASLCQLAPHGLVWLLTPPNQ